MKHVLQRFRFWPNGKRHHTLHLGNMRRGCLLSAIIWSVQHWRVETITMKRHASTIACPLVGPLFWPVAKDCAVKPVSLPRRLHLTYCSQPKADRATYRFVLKHKPCSIIEFGLGTALRATRLLALANSYAEKEEISYAGIDLFEARPESNPGTPLKRAHRLLSPLAGRVRLVPGDPHCALIQLANVVGGTDLIIISADQEPASLTQAWFYFPRMMHETTHVLWEQPQGSAAKTKFVEVSHEEIRRLAAAATPRRRAA